MATALSRAERETIIIFNEEDAIASCFTYNGKLTRRLQSLCEQKPDDIKLVKSNSEGGLTFEFPKKWITVRPPRQMSEEQAAAAAERLRLIREQWESK